jgi:hypothetical protein
VTGTPSVSPTPTITLTTTPTTTAQPSEDLNHVIVYPNPFLDLKNSSKRINFIHLTFNAKIRVYTLDGRQVWEKEKNDGSDRIVWQNVENQHGQKLASGVYIYIITNSAGQKVMGKLGVVR